MGYKVLKDGVVKVETDTLEQAFARILNLQGQSFDWALKYEGWNVEHPDGSYSRKLNKTQLDILTRCRSAKNTEPISRNIDMFQMELDEHMDPKNVGNQDRMRVLSQYLEVFRIALRERGAISTT